MKHVIDTRSNKVPSLAFTCALDLMCPLLKAIEKSQHQILCTRVSSNQLLQMLSRETLPILCGVTHICMVLYDILTYLGGAGPQRGILEILVFTAQLHS